MPRTAVQFTNLTALRTIIAELPEGQYSHNQFGEPDEDGEHPGDWNEMTGPGCALGHALRNPDVFPTLTSAHRDSETFGDDSWSRLFALDAFGFATATTVTGDAVVVRIDEMLADGVE